MGIHFAREQIERITANHDVPFVQRILAEDWLVMAKRINNLRELTHCPPDWNIETWLKLPAACHRRECERQQGGVTPDEREGMEVDIANANTIAEQADRIAELEKELADFRHALRLSTKRRQELESQRFTLRKAVRPFADDVSNIRDGLGEHDLRGFCVTVGTVRAAAAAMEATGGTPEDAIQAYAEAAGSTPITAKEYIAAIEERKADCERLRAELKAKAAECDEFDGLYADSLKAIRSMRAELDTANLAIAGLKGGIAGAATQAETVLLECRKAAGLHPRDRVSLVDYIAKLRAERKAVQAELDARKQAEPVELQCALRSIIIRCDEGSPESDWLPVISRIAKDALATVHRVEEPAEPAMEEPGNTNETVLRWPMAETTTARDIANALHDLACRTDGTFYAAIHPCGSIAIVEGDLHGRENVTWCDTENVVEKIKQTPGGAR